MKTIKATLLGIALGLLVYLLLAFYAYAERGYFALGGEFLLAVVTAVTVPCIEWDLRHPVAMKKRETEERKAIWKN